MARISGLPEQPRPLWSTVLMILSAGGSTGQLWECQICPVDPAPHWHWTFLNYAYLCSNLLKWLLWLHMAARKYMQQSCTAVQEQGPQELCCQCDQSMMHWDVRCWAESCKGQKNSLSAAILSAILSFFSQPEPTHVSLRGLSHTSRH